MARKAKHNQYPGEKVRIQGLISKEAKQGLEALADSHLLSLNEFLEKLGRRDFQAIPRSDLMPLSRLAFVGDSDLLNELQRDPVLSPTARLALRDLQLSVSLVDGPNGLVLFVGCPARSLRAVLVLVSVLKSAVEADDFFVWVTDE